MTSDMSQDTLPKGQSAFVIFREDVLGSGGLWGFEVVQDIRSVLLSSAKSKHALPIARSTVCDPHSSPSSSPNLTFLWWENTKKQNGLDPCPCKQFSLAVSPALFVIRGYPVFSLGSLSNKRHSKPLLLKLLLEDRQNCEFFIISDSLRP